MRVLISAAAGFICSKLCRRLVADSRDVVRRDAKEPAAVAVTFPRDSERAKQEFGSQRLIDDMERLYEAIAAEKGIR